MMKEPFVSICIPNYNKGQYIGDMIQSVLDQTYTNFELIIVDNASTDNSMDVINSFNDPRIRVYRNDTNIGGTENGNKCFEYAKGDYIAIFHSDDLYPKRIIELEVKGLSTFENMGIASIGYTKDLSEFETQENQENEERIIKIFPQLAYFKLMCSGITLWCPSVMLTRECHEQFPTYNPNLYEGADQVLYLQIASKYGLALIEDLKMYKRPWPREASLDEMKLWIHAYELLKDTAKDIYLASSVKSELWRYYTFFIATQDRNICRRSCLIGDYKRARKHLLLYIQNKLEITSDENITKWVRSIDDAPR